MLKRFVSIALSAVFSTPLLAADVHSLEGKPAPLFELKNQEGKLFKLEDRKDKGWTVLFFYPKAGTPGCTTEVCAFRDSVKTIKEQNAEVYGISADTVKSQKKFHSKHHLVFDLLADADAATIKKYDTKMFALDMSKRITFLLDEKLVVRKVFLDVDPALNAKQVATAIAELKKAKS